MIRKSQKLLVMESLPKAPSSTLQRLRNNYALEDYMFLIIEDVHRGSRSGSRYKGGIAAMQFDEERIISTLMFSYDDVMDNALKLWPLLKETLDKRHASSHIIREWEEHVRQMDIDEDLIKNHGAGFPLLLNQAAMVRLALGAGYLDPVFVWQETDTPIENRPFGYSRLNVLFEITQMLVPHTQHSFVHRH